MEKQEQTIRTTKKTWQKPEIELISKDAVRVGSVSINPEGVPTSFGGIGSIGS